MEAYKETIYEKALRELKEKIINGEWQPGQRLPSMKQLAQILGVSVTTIREVLHTLENKNIVSIEHGRGIYLRNDPNSSATQMISVNQDVSLLSVLKARLLVEPKQAYYCAQKADEHLCNELEAAANKLDSEMHIHDDFLKTDLLFHQLIAEGAQEPALQTMSNSIEQYQISGRRMTNTLPLMRTKAALYHQLISAGIATHNAVEAEQLMTMHIESMIAPLEQK
ncbi:FadR/GntR family transcriptional regulator [Weissella sagaensis]|uniref:FadR/GntR family transcriptional regulator n=1 Tax=Weissella sagaensis TaxID=2559928 RepID=UPI0013EBAE0F|nr:GntR family transcriptional regulator [Weissella sagaensis]